MYTAEQKEQAERARVFLSRYRWAQVAKLQQT